MLILLSFLSILFGTTAKADKPPVAWSVVAEDSGAGRVKLLITAEVRKGWHIYAMEQERDDGPLPTEFRFKPSEAYGMMGTVREPAPASSFDPNFAMTVRSHEGTVRYELLIQRRVAEPFSVEFEVEYMACDDHMCLPPLTVPLRVSVAALSADPK